MPKLAIYIPKKDMRVIEKWRKKINFSKVFMKALFDEIRDRSRIVKSDKDRLSAAAKHYKRALAESSDHLIEFGYHLGSRHVVDCRLDPDSIRQMLKIKDMDSWESADIESIEGLIGEDLPAVDELLSQNGYDEQSRPTWRNVVYRGYVKGIAAAWQQVCEHM